MQTNHLSDEQFTELLLGANPRVVREHLAACPQCAEEAQRVSAAIGSFAEQSRLWAERRAAAQQSIASVRLPRFQWLHGPRAWATAGSLAVALAAGVGYTLHLDRSGPAQPAVAHSPSAPPVSHTALQSDNELMAAVDREIREDDAATAGMYGLRVTSHNASARVPKRISD